MMRNTKKLRVSIVIFLLPYLLSIVFLSEAYADEETLIMMEDIELPVNGSNLKYLKIIGVSNLGSFQVNVNWNPDVVDVVSIVKGDFPIANYLDHGHGYMNLTGYSTDGVSGNFILAGLEFKAVGGPADTCSIEIGFHQLLTADPHPQDIESSVINGTVSIITEGMLVDIGGPYTGFVSESIQLHVNVTGGSQPYLFLWDLDDDSVFDDSSIQNPQWLWNSTGQKTIKILVKDSTNQTVIVVTTVSLSSNDQPTQPNKKPIIVASVTPTIQAILVNITFDASQSNDPEEDALTYHWDFGDNSQSSFPLLQHYYTAPGSYTVHLTVTDAQGAVNITSFLIIILSEENNPPSAPTIEGTSYGHRNTTYRYLFSSSDNDTDALQYSIDWGDTYNETTEFINESTQITRTHQWNNSGKYIIAVSSFDSYIQSKTTTLVIFIDARTVSSLGYLTDNDADGIFDEFHNETDTIQTKVDRSSDNQYRIDIDGDGIWDYMFNSKTETLHSITQEDNNNTHNLLFMILLIFFIAIIVIVAYMILKRN